MDIKSNDDSAGSDSLDKSLQQKCVVVDDSTATAKCNSHRVDSTGEIDAAPSADSDGQNENINTASEEGETQKQLRLLGALQAELATSLTLQANVNCDRSTAAATAAAANNATSSSSGGVSGITLLRAQQLNSSELTASTLLSSASSSSSSSSSSSTSSCSSYATTNNEHDSNSNCSSKPESCRSAFESKVQQIARDLRETSLEQVVDSTNTAPTPRMSSPNSNANATKPAATNEQQSDDDVDIDGASATNASGSGSASASGGRLKRVRFHPNAKENDGGNRVKKRKLSFCTEDADLAAGAAAAATNGTDSTEAESEEYDLAKTIAEAKDYLIAHPLTFASSAPDTESACSDTVAPEPYTNNVHDVVLEELSPTAAASEQMDYQDCESSSLALSDSDGESEEDLFAHALPENGVRKILGKQTNGGVVEFLVMYAEQPGLQWTSQTLLERRCPNMLALYDRNRERLQQKLMAYIAKKQKSRQRYTDF